MMSAKKRSGPGDDAVFTAGEEPKRRRNNAKKQSSFKPQPVVNSSDTPPDDHINHFPPPPPSERRPTWRGSARARDRQSVSPSRDAPSKKRKADTTSLANPGGSSTASSSRPRPSSLSHAAQSRAADQMGPPTGFVRKTRKSMRAMGLDMDDGSLDHVVPIPESETPMIRKNKELREAQQRRSSLGLRGQRASTSLGKGEISIPHSSVDTKLFYSHLGSQMPEPIRARHLIAWCAKRAVDAETGKKSRSKGKERSDEGDRIVNEIMEEFITSLGRGEVDTNVFASVSSKGNALLRPHPRNVANKETYAKEEAIMRRCKDENNQWAKLINTTNRRLQDTVEMTAAKRNDRTAENGPEMTNAGWMTDALQIAEGIIAEGEGDLTKMGEFEDVEFKIDSLLSSTHVAVQYSRQAERFLDGIFSALTLDLRNRERAGLPSILPADETDGPDPVALLSTAASSNVATTSTAGQSTRKDPMFTLRALASADSRTQNDEAVAAAARVAPVQSLTVMQSGPNLGISEGPGAAATPRRVGTATPRRAGGRPINAAPTPRSIGVKESE